MSQSIERDYILGTHEEEMARLGVQHRAWRNVVLDCWKNAGITTGHRVLDVGAGPGYATVDLAEIVGRDGQVVALERSHNFVNAIKAAAQKQALTNIEAHERDLINDDLPSGPFDFSWCRWVLCFLSDPELVVRKLAGTLRRGGRAIFHEYGHYTTWRFFPARPSFERFRDQFIADWRQSGGEPDIGLKLPQWLKRNGFILKSVTPRLFCLRPGDYMWQWPAQFVRVHISHLQNIGRIDAALAEELRRDLAAAEKETPSFMLTPLVLEIVAEKA